MTKNRDLLAIGFLLVMSMAVGGSGISFPQLNLLLQLATLLVAVYYLVTDRTLSLHRLNWLALALLGAIVALPLLQLVPLPPPIWTNLPGRALPAELDAALNVQRWRPLTLDVEGTLRSFITLLPAAMVFIGALFLPRSQRAKLLWVVVAGALVSALLGIVEVATGGWLTPYISGHFGDATGLFVNRNHNAALLLTAMPIAAALAAGQIANARPQASWITAAVSAIAFLAIGVLGTTSRMGLLLTPLAVAASLALLAYGRARWPLVVAATAGVAAVATSLFASNRFERILSRFSGLDDPRLDYWTDLHWALDHYGLVGTGFGTFVPVYKSAESLEAVVPRLTNHAHNDYLEVLLEGGLPAALLIVLVVTLLVVSVFYAFKNKPRPAQALAIVSAVTGIAILLAASVVDYPLRMPALSAVFALLCAIILPSRRAAVTAKAGVPALRRTPAARRGWMGAGLAVAAALFVMVVQASRSAHFLQQGQNETALRWAGWATQAHERQATDDLLQHHSRAAFAHASAAIGLSPISAPAIRSIGFVRLAEGRNRQGTALMQMAVILGWRDTLTQMWAIEAARISREPDKALQRAEAVFRRNVRAAPVIAQILSFPPDSTILPLLGQKLARQPEWRGAFFEASGQLPPEAADAWLRLITILDRTNAPVSVREGDPALQTLLANGRIDHAQRLWAVLQDRGQLVSNGDFQTVDTRRDATAPASWHVPAINRWAVKVEPLKAGSSERALHVRSPKGPVILQQTLMLSPGSYTIAFRARAAGTKPVVLRWELQCADSDPRQRHDVTIPPTSQWVENSSVVTVPLRYCPIQRLAFGGAGGMPLDDVWIDLIQLNPADR